MQNNTEEALPFQGSSEILITKSNRHGQIIGSKSVESVAV